MAKRKVFKSSITGRFVSKGEAESDPDKTFSMTVKSSAKNSTLQDLLDYAQEMAAKLGMEVKVINAEEIEEEEGES